MSGLTADDDPLLEVWLHADLASEHDARPPIVALEGELCYFSAQRARLPLQRLVAHTHAVTVDLSQLRFIDCAGVRLLDEICGCVRSRGGTVEIRGAQPPVAKVLQLVSNLIGR